MIIVVVLTVLIYGSLMPLVAHLLLGDKEIQHQGKKVMIKTGRSFNQTPEHPELQNAFNHKPADGKIQPTTPPEENDSDESVDLSAQSDSPKSAKSGDKKSEKSEEFEEFVHENEMKEENDGRDSDVTMYEPC